jgi:hypothetical protein
MFFNMWNQIVERDHRERPVCNLTWDRTLIIILAALSISPATIRYTLMVNG